MLSLLRHVNREHLEPLSSTEAAEGFLRSLPRDDPIVSQQMLCAALAQIGRGRDPDITQLQALVSLDHRARPLLDRLVSKYFALSVQSTDRELQLRQAIFELSGSFAFGYDMFVRYLRDKNPGKGWLPYLPVMLTQLFRHRELELFLLLLRYESWPRGRSRGLNQAFQLALAHGFGDCPVAREQRDGNVTRTITPEQAFIRILLLRLVDSTALTPQELSVVWRFIAEWSMRAKLQRVNDAGTARADGFVLDLFNTDGLRRPSASTATTGELLHLDTTPLIAAVDKALVKTRDTAANAGNALGINARPVLLLKLRRMLSPQPERIRRRGERTEVTLMSVQTIGGGIPGIFRMLHEESRRLAALQNSPDSYAESITITSSAAHPRTGNTEPLRPTVWQVRDQSASGFRLRGRVAHTQQLIPGSLIVFRDDDAAPWILAVVRRLKRIVGNNFEVGVERIGSQPQCVVLLADSIGTEPPTAAEKSERCPALFLQESDPQSRAPIKTLVLPALDYAPGREFTMVSKSDETRIRLREPIEQQGEFVWASLETLKTRTRFH